MTSQKNSQSLTRKEKCGHCFPGCMHEASNTGHTWIKQIIYCTIRSFHLHFSFSSAVCDQARQQGTPTFHSSISQNSWSWHCACKCASYCTVLPLTEQACSITEHHVALLDEGHPQQHFSLIKNDLQKHATTCYWALSTTIQCSMWTLLALIEFPWNPNFWTIVLLHLALVSALFNVISHQIDTWLTIVRNAGCQIFQDTEHLEDSVSVALNLHQSFCDETFIFATFAGFLEGHPEQQPICHIFSHLQPIVHTSARKMGKLDHCKEVVHLLSLSLQNRPHLLDSVSFHWEAVAMKIW